MVLEADTVLVEPPVLAIVARGVDVAVGVAVLAPVLVVVVDLWCAHTWCARGLEHAHVHVHVCA